MRILKDISLNVISAEVDTIGRNAFDVFQITYHGEPLPPPMCLLVVNSLQVLVTRGGVPPGKPRRGVISAAGPLGRGTLPYSPAGRARPADVHRRRVPSACRVLGRRRPCTVQTQFPPQKFPAMQYYLSATEVEKAWSESY